MKDKTQTTIMIDSKIYQVELRYYVIGPTKSQLSDTFVLNNKLQFKKATYIF